jgi:hypothetical protein
LNRAAISFYNSAPRKRLATVALKGHVLSELKRRTLHRSSPLLLVGDHNEDPTMPGWDTFARKKVGHRLKGFQTLHHLMSCLVAAKVQGQVSKSTACFHP